MLTMQSIHSIFTFAVNDILPHFTINLHVYIIPGIATGCQMDAEKEE